MTTEPRRCHRCQSLCDAYTHETIIICPHGWPPKDWPVPTDHCSQCTELPVYFCTFYCAKFYHDSTGEGIMRTATKEIVLHAGKPLYLREAEQTKFFFTEEDMKGSEH